MVTGTSAGTGEAVSGINVTPLIDVFLVLLIIFMVIVPATPKGLSSEIPEARRHAPQRNDAVVLQVAVDGSGELSYLINQSPLSKAQMVPQLTRIFSARQNRQIFVQGDPRVSYASIAEVIDMAHQADVNEIGLITPARQTETIASQSSWQREAQQHR